MEFHQQAAPELSEGFEAGDAKTMLLQLADGHAFLIKQWEKLIELSNQHGDDTTADLATQRLAWHEKTLWMLRSSVG